MKTFFIRTFGCQQNVADSERLASYYEARGHEQVDDDAIADLVVINSCMVRDKAEERVYGYIRNLRKVKNVQEQRIVLTGCVTGAAAREPSGKLAKKLQDRIPDVELLPLEDVGFEPEPKRGLGKNTGKHAWVVLSNGCNNYCTFCIVPFARGKEVSRPFADIINEIDKLVADGYTSVTLLGQNVNSYGSDLVFAQKKEERKYYVLPSGEKVEPIFVTHLGRHRIPTLFPYLLDAVARKNIKTVTFTSSNPWDFSDALIDVIAKHKNIDRLLHLPVQSGSDTVLQAMNRWYSAQDYIDLTARIRAKVPQVQFVTDIIVGFAGETDEDFQATINLSKKVGFVKAFIGQYSERPGTVATGKMDDTISREEKKRRWEIINNLINVPNIGVSYSKDWIRTREATSVR